MFANENIDNTLGSFAASLAPWATLLVVIITTIRTMRRAVPIWCFRLDMMTMLTMRLG